MRNFLFTFSCLICTFTLFSQEPIKGSVTYEFDITGSNAAMVSSVLPKKMIHYYSDSGMVTIMEGGMMDQMMDRMVVKTNDKMAYMVNDDKQTVYRIDLKSMQKATDDLKEADEAMELIEGETLELLGYKCNKYQTTIIQNGLTVKAVIWTTDEITIPDMERGTESLSGGFIPSNIKGFPLKIEATMEMLQANYILKVTEIDPNADVSALLEIPADYAVEDYDATQIIGN